MHSARITTMLKSTNLTKVNDTIVDSQFRHWKRENYLDENQVRADSIVDSISEETEYDTFTSTLIGVVKNWYIFVRIFINIIYNMIMWYWPIVLLLFVFYVGSLAISLNSDSVVTTVLTWIVNLRDYVDSIVTKWNNFSMYLPDMATAYNAAIEASGSFFSSSMSVLCPAWPPNGSIQDECPRMYRLLGFFSNLAAYLTTLWSMITAFYTTFIEIINNILYGTPISSVYEQSLGASSGDSLDAFGLIQWILDMIIWIFTDMLSSVTKAIDFVFYESLGFNYMDRSFLDAVTAGRIPNISAENRIKIMETLNSVPAQSYDPRVIATVVSLSADAIFKGFVRVFLNLTYSNVDRLLCSVIIQPGPCFIQDVCRDLFAPFWLRLPCFLGICIKIRVDLRFLCIFISGVCECYRCVNPLGILVPCVLYAQHLQDLMCRCDESLTFYPLLSSILNYIGITSL